MCGAFVNFAKTGDPNVEGLPRWEPCKDGKMLTLTHDNTYKVNENMQDELLPLVQQYKPRFQFQGHA